MSLHFYGIRHHGPGSARSLSLALARNVPDCVLVEGPPDAAAVLPLLGDAQMDFPVALLLYVPDDPKRATYFPFAAYSPETVAIRFALERGIPVRFMDLPMAHVLARRESKPVSVENPPSEPVPEATVPSPRADPLGWLAQAAGYEDSERWWEDLVEHRRDESGIFEAVGEAMTALRAEMDSQSPLESEKALEEEQREAWMRGAVRAAQKEGFGNIAVVCGAWHVPALQGGLSKSDSPKEDAATLKNLPRTKVAATWVPWTNNRLSFASGYGAGIESPGWYEHLWRCRADNPEEIAPRWMARVAGLLRAQDLDASPAHLIEAVRLAQTLAALRGRAIAGLEELTEATRSVLGFGDDAVLNLIERDLVVGEKMGAVPDASPTIPLQNDLAGEQKRLRFPPESAQKVFDFDLRKPNDLDRSRLLHRLQILDIPWGALERNRSGKGTFHELWRVQWAPELAIPVIQAGIWGNTVAAAATAKASDRAAKSSELPALSALLDATLLADLPRAIELVMRRVENVAATSTDAAHLMDALPPLARIHRYGDVRGTKIEAVAPILEGIGARLWINLPLACAAQNDDAAREFLPRFQAVASALSLWQNEGATAGWQGALKNIAARDSMPGLLAGRATRILLDAEALGADEVATTLSFALSSAIDPTRAASWIEGFLGQSGLLLLHDERLWRAIDNWVCGLSPEAFTPILPLLRRTWSQFAPAERREMGEMVRRPREAAPLRSAGAAPDFDVERAQSVLPVLAQLLGIEMSDSRAAQGVI